MEWQSVNDRRETNAIEEVIADGVERRLALRSPLERYGLAITTAGEGSERFGNLAVSALFSGRDIVFGLHEDAEDVTQFRQVRGGNTFTNRVEVLVAKTAAFVVSGEGGERGGDEAAEPGMTRGYEERWRQSHGTG